MKTNPISGKVVVVTGAASGIGQACADLFKENDAIVITLDQVRNSAVDLVCDVSDSSSVVAGIKDIEKINSRIDVLVNCAGTNVRGRHFTNNTTEDWDHILAVNLSGMFYGCQAVLPGMRQRKSGTIINFSSWAGKYATYFPGVAYSASKRGVLALTESINIEEGINGIRATAIVPEEVATAIVDKRPIPPTGEERARMLTPKDVASSVVYVASLPDRVCINELVISPVWNRNYLGLHATAMTKFKN